MPSAISQTRPSMAPRHSSASMISQSKPTCFSSPREHWQLAVEARCSALHTLTVPDAQVDGAVAQLFDDELRAMREALAQMETLRNRVVVHATMLPLQLLARVFFFASELWAPPGGYPGYCKKQQPVSAPVPDLVVCSHVCKKWRTVALGHPELWTSLSFPALAAPLARLFAERARHFPLDVSIDASLVLSQWPRAFARGLQDANAVPRVQTLALAADIASQRGMSELRELLSVFGAEARSLRTLSIHGAHRGTAAILKLPRDLFADAPGLSTLSLGHVLPSPDAPMVRGLTRLDVRAPYSVLAAGESSWLDALLRNARRLQTLTVFIDDAFKPDIIRCKSAPLYVPDSLRKVTLHGAAPACASLALRLPPDLRVAMNVHDIAGPQLPVLLDTRFPSSAPVRSLLLSVESNGRGLAALGAWHDNFARHDMPGTTGSETPPGSLLSPKSSRPVALRSSASSASSSRSSSYGSLASAFAGTSVSSRTSAPPSPGPAAKPQLDMGILNVIPPSSTVVRKPTLWLDARRMGGGIVPGAGCSVIQALGMDLSALEKVRVDERDFDHVARRKECSGPAWTPSGWHAAFGSSKAMKEVFVHGPASQSLLVALSTPHSPSPAGSRRNSRELNGSDVSSRGMLFPDLELLELHEIMPEDVDVSGALARRAQVLGRKISTLRLPRAFECVRGFGRGANEVDFFD
ncbi:hypothetical protein PENSPDRAFT_671884 [Peniophora sp. CONT]|nr:hypothetical protein PENSPDRAFT_671884 [Peniophora sp. CONT]